MSGQYPIPYPLLRHTVYAQLSYTCELWCMFDRMSVTHASMYNSIAFDAAVQHSTVALGRGSRIEAEGTQATRTPGVNEGRLWWVPRPCIVGDDIWDRICRPNR